MPTVDLADDECVAVTAAILVPSKTTGFLAPRASIRCARRWQSSTQR
jgi:hypothetical protein